MLIHAILELQDQIKKSPLGADRIKVAREVEKAAMNAVPVSEMRGLLA
jgi:NADH-quinone oxidoreductase subunit B